VSVDHRPRHELQVDDFGFIAEVLDAEVLNIAERALIDRVPQAGIPIQ
jgi:hypothetical protein